MNRVGIAIPLDPVQEERREREDGRGEKQSQS